MFTEPNIPTLRCTTLESDHIVLQITKGRGQMTQFEIVCKGPGCPTDSIKNTPQGNIGSHKFSELTPYTSYTFKVISVKITGRNPPRKSSAEVTITCPTAQKGIWIVNCAYDNDSSHLKAFFHYT